MHFFFKFIFFIDIYQINLISFEINKSLSIYFDLALLNAFIFIFIKNNFFFITKIY